MRPVSSEYSQESASVTPAIGGLYLSLTQKNVHAIKINASFS